ncbi:protein stoned-B-like [Maniola jurtina]|uniref:protein stoned-B-like n=1 Tax=Maniola jurtina TaxID=191418 RepID=UPI001E686B21|nr:protein stoned-B-like [Maniola jurtina]
MLKLPKGLKKKKKGKKSKRKGEDELFTEEELEKYRREHQQQAESGEASAKENEEWSKFKDLTSGVDTVLKRTQGDLDRIKSTSFFQRVKSVPKEVKPAEKEKPHRPVVEVTEADFPQLLAAKADADGADKSDCGVTDDESEYEDDQDDIFDTSYVDAVERGEVKLAYVSDSPEDFQDDDIFDTSHVDALIKGQQSKSTKGKKALDIGVAVEVLTGRIDNVTITTKRPKRVVPGDLLLDTTDREPAPLPAPLPAAASEPVQKSILDLDTDVPITAPIDLTISLHTSLLQQQKHESQEDISTEFTDVKGDEEVEIDEFTLLATESLEVKSTVTKLEEKEITVEPVLQESWSAFEADKNESVFAEGIVEDQLDVIDPYLDQDDPFDTSFADAVIPTSDLEQITQEAVILEEDDDFDPRAEEVQVRLNNRRKSSVRINLINPSGIRESITSDEIIETENQTTRDLLGGSSTDLTQLGDSPLDPLDISNGEVDPFDTTIVDRIVAPGKVELKLLERELIGSEPTASIYRVPSDPDFDPRADEPIRAERRASRPENLIVNKSVVFSVDGRESSQVDGKSKPGKPLTPYYTRELSITEDKDEEAEAADSLPELTRAHSEEDLTTHTTYPVSKRRHSELPRSSHNQNILKASDLLHGNPNDIEVKVLTPTGPPKLRTTSNLESDPFDTSFAANTEPSKTELKLLAKEFSCDDDTASFVTDVEAVLLETSDDIFQIKALTPEPPDTQNSQEDFDPFDTSFASDLNPGRTEINTNEMTAPISTEVLNPFMMSDSEPSDFGTGDNPFATSNPFSDFAGNYEPQIGDTVPADIFGGAEPERVCAKQFATDAMDIFDSQPMETERPTKPTELELVTTMVDCSYASEEETGDLHSSTRPLPPETQNLILTVTGQMEFTSSDLLDRIPPTRTPSPVSVRDIASPSPTPEPDAPDDAPERPARAAPARPPRPAPPPRPLPPRAPPDDINLFDAPVPTLVKPTKEAIMSLYSAPKKEEKQIDFLSDDIPELSSDVEIQSRPTDIMLKPAAADSADLLFAEPETSVAENATEPKTQNTMLATPTSNPIEEAGAPMDCSEPSLEARAASSSASPFADVADDSCQVQRANESDKNPFETDDVKAHSPFDASDAEIPRSEDVNMTTNIDDTPFTANDTFTSAPHSNAGGSPMDVFGVHDDNQANVFGAADDAAATDMQTTSSADIGWNPTETGRDAFTKVQDAFDAFPQSQDAFDAFSEKFDSTGGQHMNTDAWGDDGGADAGPAGFEADAFDPFLSMGAPPPPAATPRLDHQDSRDSTDDTFSVFIRPKESEATGAEPVPVLAPPPRPHALPDAARQNPFDASEPCGAFEREGRPRAGSGGSGESGGGGRETPPTPLFDDDVSQPLEDFPRVKYDGPGWEMQLRQPNKKKITGQRFWKKIFVRLALQGDSPVVQLLNSAGDKEPLQELPLQACYSVSEVGAQQFDQFGKIFTVKLQYVFYKERPGVRPGQVTKAERITNKLSQFAAYAIQGDYQGVKEFGSDLRKLGLPVEHAPQVSQLFKIGSLNYEDVKQFSCCVEEALFRLAAHRDRALTYKMEEVQITAVDELYVEQDAEGAVLKQIARVRVFFLGFLSGMPDVELGVNDLRRQGREVVGRHDIIPVATEEWIRVEEPEFHACVTPQAFEDDKIIKFKPPDACYIELLRFRVRPPKNRELPLQLKAVWCVTGNKVELRADVLVPGFASRALGQVPCEDVAIRFPIPECWIYLFRVEKHFRYGSVKSAHRRTGKIKGIERFLGAVDTLQESLIEVTSGQAKYEHQHRAIVWRMPRLPKEGQGAYTTHNLVCRMALTSYDQIPEELAKWAHVEFTMPATQVSHTTVRSVSLQQHDGDPPEKYVRYLARHEYIVGIERTSGQAVAAYALAASKDKEPERPAEPAPPAPPAPSSDSDSE